MFQVLATIFFSASGAVAAGVIVTMFNDNIADVRRALGCDNALSGSWVPPRPRRVQHRDLATVRAARLPGRQRAAA
jgi:hypothetical protein